MHYFANRRGGDRPGTTGYMLTGQDKNPTTTQSLYIINFEIHFFFKLSWLPPLGEALSLIISKLL